MADITMCDGKGCTRKDSCYRHVAPRNEFRQAQFNVAPWYQGEHRAKQACKYYWPINSDPVAEAQSE